MESAFMTVAKEIRSRDQGYTQQAGDSFTVKTVGRSIRAAKTVADPRSTKQILAWSSQFLHAGVQRAAKYLL